MTTNVIVGIASDVLANGTATGVLYAFMAVGFSLIYHVSGDLHFAHGSVFVIAAYAYTTAFELGYPLAGVTLALAIAILLGIGCNRYVYVPIRERGGTNETVLIASFALLVVLNAVILLVFGTDVRSLSVPSTFQLQMIKGSITGIQGAMFAVLFVAFALAVVFFRLTKFGIAMRATASNEQLARVVGVNSDKMVSISYVVGSLFVGLGAVFLVFVENIGPTTGGPIVLKAFTATVVGGLGSFRGALLGSLLVGYVEVAAILLLPTGYNEGVVFALLFVFLLGKPNGLFGEGHLWN